MYILFFSYINAFDLWFSLDCWEKRKYTLPLALAFFQRRNIKNFFTNISLRLTRIKLTLMNLLFWSCCGPTHTHTLTHMYVTNDSGKVKYIRSSIVAFACKEDYYSGGSSLHRPAMASAAVGIMFLSRGSLSLPDPRGTAACTRAAYHPTLLPGLHRSPPRMAVLPSVPEQYRTSLDSWL